MGTRRAPKLRQTRELLRDLPAGEAAVFRDEADLNPNPDTGRMWTPRGEQAAVVTPGTNVRRYLAGSTSWRTGELVETVGTRRNPDLFVRHPDDLRLRLRLRRRRRSRHYKVTHVVCDNARFHTPEGSLLVRAYPAAWATASPSPACRRTRPTTTRSSGRGGTRTSGPPATTALPGR